MNQQTIVIGSGLSGLVSALLLARSGRQVTVVEQHPLPAPVVRGFSRGGIYFDSGLHYIGGLGPGGAFARLFKHLGLAQRLQLIPFAEDGFDGLRFCDSGRTISMPVGYERITARLQETFPQVAREIADYIGQVRDEWWRFPYLDPDMGTADFSMASVHGPSLGESLRPFAAHPELLALLSMHSLLYGIATQEAPRNLNMQVAGSYYHSVHAIRGGGQALVETLLQLLAEAGAEVRCGFRVADILLDGGQVTAVRSSEGEHLPAAAVIATLNPVLLPELLPPGALRPAYRKRLQQLRQTTSAYLLFGRCASVPPLMDRRNLFVQQQPGPFSLDWDTSVEKRGFYLTSPSQGAAGAGLVAIVPASYTEVSHFDAGYRSRQQGYREFKEELAARWLAQIEDCCPELHGLEAIDLATPLSLRDYSQAPAGAIYGVGHHLGQYNPHPTTRVPGLFLSGQAIAAPGFLGAVVAAYLTCGTILGHDLLQREIKLCS